MRTSARYHRRLRLLERGNSAVEVLASAVLIALMVVSVSGGFSGAFILIEDTREELRATQILVEKLETIRLYTFDQIETPGFLPATFSVPFDYTATNDGALTYTGRIVVENSGLATPYADDMKKVTINLSWSFGMFSSEGKTPLVKNRSMSTWITKNGLQAYVY